MKLLVIPLLALGVLAAAAPAALAHCGTAHATATLPPDVVLHIATGPGVFSPEGPEVTVFTDGRVFIDRAFDGPEHVELTIPSVAVERLLDDARRAGALRDFDFGDAEITDQATTTIEVAADGRHRKHSIYALIFSGAGYSSGENPLTDEQAEARQRLGSFVLDASDPARYAKWETIEHPTGSSDVVFTTRTERNGWGGEYPDAVDVTIYGDGRVVSGDGTTKPEPSGCGPGTPAHSEAGPERPGARGAESGICWSERRLQRFLREARDIRLLGDAAYGEAMVTDQGTTTVEIHAGGIDRALAIYALELPAGDRGLPREQREARRDLRRFLHKLP